MDILWLYIVSLFGRTIHHKMIRYHILIIQVGTDHKQVSENIITL